MSVVAVDERTLAARVAAGAAFLDEHDPDWWKPGEIDLENLMLSSTRMCVLGQRCPVEVLIAYCAKWEIAVHESDRYEAYAYELSGLTEYDGITPWAREHGFTCIPERDQYGYYELTAKWVSAITERRTADAA